MAIRYHLGSIEKPDGTIWLTLVYDGSFTFFVEWYNDSRLSFLKDRLKIIRPDELDRHEFDGIRLAELVERKLRQVEKGEPGLAALLGRRKRFASGRGGLRFDRRDDDILQ